MRNFFNKLKIPTIFGLSIIMIGIIVGVFLTLREQIFTSQAAPSNTTAENITISNISDTETVISWQTSTPSLSFITYGATNPSETTLLDDRDIPFGKPVFHLIHYATIKNLLPSTTYQFKVISGKLSSEVQEFKTATPVDSKTGSQPIIGTVLDENKPLDEGLIYLSIANATIQSAIIKQGGNFLIPTSDIRNIDLSSNIILTEDTIGKLSIISSKGQTNVVFKLKDIDKALPPIKIGQDLDLTNNTPISSANSYTESNQYDLNEDGKINSADNAIILQNLGKSPKNKNADLNKDGIVDKTDLDLMTKQVNQ